MPGSLFQSTNYNSIRIDNHKEFLKFAIFISLLYIAIIKYSGYNAFYLLNKII